MSVEVGVEVAAGRGRPGETPPHAPLIRLQLRERRPRHRRKRDVVIGQVHGEAVNPSAIVEQVCTPRRVVQPEHVVIDEELRAPSEEVCQGGAALVGVEFVLLVDPDPRQLLPASRQLIAAMRQLLLRLKQLEPRRKPLFTCPGLCAWSSFLSLNWLVMVVFMNRISSLKARSRSRAGPRPVVT